MKLGLHIVVLTGLCLTLLCTGAQAQKKKKKKPAQPAEWWKAKQPRFAGAQIGPVFSATIDARKGIAGTTYKGQAIRIGQPDGKQATFLFDTELLRASAAVPDHFVSYNTYRDGLGGAGHVIGKPYIFETRPVPGWAIEGKFEDPRSDKRGPMPRGIGRYTGMYRYGQQVVFSYTVGKAAVLETPGLESKGDIHAVSRTLNLKSARTDMLMRVCDRPAKSARVEGNVAILEGPDSVTAVAFIASRLAHKSLKFLTEKETIALKISPAAASLRFKLLIWTGPANQLDAFIKLAAASESPADLTAMTKGTTGIWNQTITTRGKLGAGKGAYVVDTLTIPWENPYKLLFRFGGHDFFSNGDAAICTIDGDVWHVSGIDDKLEKITWKRYATGLFHPLGLKIVDDKVYILGRDQITRLHDFNGDREADFYENFNNDIKIGKHVHEYAIGLSTDPAGNFYFLKGNNGNQTVHDASACRVSKDGSKFEIFATGFRWPNGMGVSPDGVVTSSDQQGTWVPSSRIDILTKGGFYGYIPGHHREKKPETYDGPLCWIPHKVDNSSAGQAWVIGNKWGLPAGTMLHLSYGKCKMFSVLQQKVGNVNQAAVWQFPVTFDSGGMRGRFNAKDGQFYVSGLKGWQTRAAKDGCFQRVRYTGAKVYQPVGFAVHKNGILISFSQPLDKKLAEDLESWAIEQWNYQWTRKYGSKEYSVKDPSKIGHDPVAVKSAKLQADGKSVFLRVDDLKPVMQMMIKYDLEATDGKEIVGAVYNTIHALAPTK